MRKTLQIVVVVMVAGALSCSVLHAQAAPKVEQQKSDAKPAQVTQSFKLEYSIFELENGKRVNGRSYVVFATDDGRDAHLKTGSRVPVALASGGNSALQYVDVGVNIRPNLLQREGGLFLVSQIEANSIAPEQKDQAFASTTPVIRALEARASNAVVIGKPMLIASMDDAASARRYEVEVTVTKQ